MCVFYVVRRKATEKATKSAESRVSNHRVETFQPVTDSRKRKVLGLDAKNPKFESSMVELNSYNS